MTARRRKETLARARRLAYHGQAYKPEDLFAFSYEGFIYEPKLGERLRVGERCSGIPDFPHFIMQ